MNFQPDPAELHLWDTWAYVTEQNEVHLFYLANRPGGAWGYAGHAVSDDWLHWRDLPQIQLRGDEGAWDGGPTGTGDTNGSTLPDRKAYDLFEGTCRQSFATRFKLYKLYTRAAGFQRLPKR